MWIIPSKIQQLYPSAQALVASKEDLKTHWEANQEWPLMSKSKPLSLPTLLRAWKWVPYLPPLCGQILKHSQQGVFLTEYTASLAVIHASPSAKPDSEKAQKTHDTFGRLYAATSAQLSLFGVFSKTSQDTSVWDSNKFTETYTTWATQLRQESLQRRKLARHTDESASSSLQYRTHTSQASGISSKRLKGKLGSRLYDQLTGRNVQYGLSQQVEILINPLMCQAYVEAREEANWPTPTSADIFINNLKSSQQKQGSMHSVNLPQAVNWSTPTAMMDSMYPDLSENRNSDSLATQAHNWTTPQSRDYKGKSSGHQKGKDLPAMVSIFGEVEYLEAQENFPTPNASDYAKASINQNQDSLQKRAINGQLDQGSHNTDGKSQEQAPRRNLNPAWVCQLMGTTIEKSFFVHSATAWLAKRPAWLLETC